MKYVIFHGTMGSPMENWFDWMRQQLEGQGHQVVVPALPTPEGQNPEEWLAATNKQVSFEFDSDTVLIGHSMGANFLLHLLDKEMPEPISKAILVSGFNRELGVPDFDPLIKPFVRDDFNWDRIQKNASDIWVIHGDDDPYVPVSEAEMLCDKLDADYHLLPDAGHINANKGYTSFPYLLELL